MNPDRWNNLQIERVARPQMLSDERFREWIANRGIFISSRRDTEMIPFRASLRQYLYSIGARPVLWEEITPQDQTSERAYLDGVDQSELFVLLVGRSYGVADSSGYSPIHKEMNQATQSRMPRLLFMLEGVQDAERDGRFNDWLQSLYKQISVASFSTSDSLIYQLDMRLREMAAQSSRFWIKLDNLVFPGTVKTESNLVRGGNRFIVTARVTQGGVRHALMQLSDRFGRSVKRLTWADQSFLVQVDSVATESEFTSENAVCIECSTPQNTQNSPDRYLEMMSIGSGVHGKSLGPADLGAIWADKAIFGIASDMNDRDLSFVRSLTQSAESTLPEILQDNAATGWVAEGLARLYIVEELRQRYSGYFEHLEVGAATAQGVRVDGVFVLESSSFPTAKVIPIQGIVPINRSQP